MAKRRNTASVPAAQKAAARLERAMELPAGSFGLDTHIEIWGGRRAVVENCRGVLEYEEGVVRLAVTGGEVRLTGTALDIRALGDNEAIVCGSLAAVEFL